MNTYCRKISRNPLANARGISITIPPIDFSFTATGSERGKINLIMNTLRGTVLDTSFKRENFRLSRFDTLKRNRKKVKEKLYGLSQKRQMREGLVFKINTKDLVQFANIIWSDFQYNDLTDIET